MSKRYTFLLSFLAMTLLAVGCDMNSGLDSTDKDTANTGIVRSGEEADTVDDEIVSVERFMEYTVSHRRISQETISWILSCNTDSERIL